jgi:hypothetical protein
MRLVAACVAILATLSCGSGTLVINSNETVTGSVAQDAVVQYSYVVSGPNMAVTFSLVPVAPGDVDLEVVWAADNSIKWTSGLVGADEVTYFPPKAGGLCVAGNPSTCTFSVRVLGFTASEFSLVITESTPPPDGSVSIPTLPSLPPGGATGDIASEGEESFLVFPPPGDYALRANATGLGDADVDLYITTLSGNFQWGSFNVGPDSIQFGSGHPYACRAGPTPCAYIVTVYNAGDAGGFSLTATFDAAPGSSVCQPARFVPGVFE